MNAAPADAPRSWGTEFRRHHRSTPGFREFSEIIGRWQTDSATCRSLQDEARRIIAGTGSSGEALVLLRALASAEQNAPCLYRGLSAPEVAWDVLHQYPVGLEFDIPLASFSTMRNWAEEFAWMTRNEGDTEVILVLLAGSQSVRIDVLAPDDIHWREREWYTGGRFVVIDSRVASGPNVEIIIEQTGIYNV